MTATKKSTPSARTELQAWYLEGLLPKLTRAARTGGVDPRAVDALDGEMRAFLDLARARESAA
jgi:hypothetical protein